MTNLNECYRTIKIEKLVQSYDKPIHYDKDDRHLVFGLNDVMDTKVYRNTDLETVRNEILNSNINSNSQFFILHSGTDEDSAFWSDENKRMFLSISFIKLRDIIKCEMFSKKENITWQEYSNQLEGVWEIHNKAKKEMMENIKERGSVIFYNTLDEYDLVMCISANSYKTIVEQISILLNKLEVIDIYSIVCTHFSNFIGFEKKYCNDVTKEKYKTVFLRLDIKNTLQNSDTFKETFENYLNSIGITEFSCEYITGSNDVGYLLSNIDISQIFSLYSSKESILSLENRKNNKYIYSSDLEVIAIDDSNNYSIRLCDGEVCLPESGKILDEARLLGWTREKEINSAEIKKIYNLFNNCYLSSSLDSATYTTYHTLKHYWNKMGPAMGDIDFFENFNNLYESILDIYNICDSSTMKTSTNISSISDFYLTPSKLVLFYSALLWRIKSLLIALDNKGETKHFSLLINPNRELSLSILPIFSKTEDENYNDRLLLVNIPIKNFFSPEISTIFMVHEVAHYIGDVTRQREVRFNKFFQGYEKYIINEYIDILDKELFEGIEDEQEQLITSQKWSEMKKSDKEYVSTFYSIFADLKKQLYIEKDTEEYYWHQVKRDLVDKLPFALHEFAEQISERVLNEFLNNYSLGDKDFFIVNRLVRKVIEKTNIISSDINFIENILVYISNVFDLYSECYADLMSVLLLNLKYDDYLKAIMSNIGNADIDELDYIYIRVSAIYEATGLNKKDHDPTFNPEIKTKISKYCKDLHGYIESSKDDKISYDWSSNYFEHPFTLQFLVDYLKTCFEEYKSLTKDNQEAHTQRIEEFTRLYETLKGKNIGENMRAMENLIQEYKYYINSDILKLFYK